MTTTQQCVLEQKKGGEYVEPSDELLTMAAAAKLLGVDRSTIKRYEDRERLVPAKIEYQGQQRRPLFRRSDVEALRKTQVEGMA